MGKRDRSDSRKWKHIEMFYGANHGINYVAHI